MGAYSFMLMNFNLVKWRLASLRPILHQLQEVLQELTTMADNTNGFDKDLFNN
jgi:2-oxoglutarate dehydrogenase E1 component